MNIFCAPLKSRVLLAGLGLLVGLLSGGLVCLWLWSNELNFKVYLQLILSFSFFGGLLGFPAPGIFFQVFGTIFHGILGISTVQYPRSGEGTESQESSKKK